jgi:muramoyltetrapeptide carboxypeptidase
MIRPPALHPGDKIGIIAPGRKVSLSDVEVAINLFKTWQLDVVLANNLFSSGHSYMAGTDDQRRDDFQSMLDDPAVKAIVSARGGYGSSRILDQLDFSRFQKNPKWIAGFSDITAIHLKLFTLGYQSIHATMPILFSKATSAESVTSLKNVLFGAPASLQAEFFSGNRTGKSEGQIVGGNLSLIVDALGTASEPDTDGKILVIEEVEEYLYKMDRMITHLKRAGKLKNLAGLVVGHMTNILDCELSFGETVEDIVRYHTKEYTFPVAFRFPTGHENPNLAWIHGGQAQLEVTPEISRLSFLQPL